MYVTQNTDGRNLKCVQHSGRKMENIFLDLGIDRKVILKCILNKIDEMIWTGLISLMAGTVGLYEKAQEGL